MINDPFDDSIRSRIYTLYMRRLVLLSNDEDYPPKALVMIATWRQSHGPALPGHRNVTSPQRCPYI